MSNYKTEINRLTKEVDEQRKKLDEIGGADNTTKRKPGVSTEGRIGKAALQSYGEWELRGTGFGPRLRQYPAAAGFRVQQRGSASD